ncbi:MAG: energy transducer TonB [Acidobacteriaceae bacterium]|nr:energy transducer TonB [Acidobacteriaceae bacterium]
MEHPQASPSDRHLDRLFVGTDLEEPWFKSIVRSIREALNPPKLPPLELTSRPLEDADLGSLNKVEQPWFKSFFSNIRDLIRPPKLPPLQMTSKPVEIGSIWGAYSGGETKSGAVSILIHVGVVALLLLVFQSKPLQKKARELGQIIYLPEFKLPPAAQKSGGGGGGGQKMPEPVNKGAAPQFARKQFQPPAFAVPKPVLPMTPTITAPIPQIQAENYGDPLAKVMQQSAGPGVNGMGSGSGNGLGPGNGNGYGPGSGGGIGGGVYQIGGDVSQPVPIFRPEPEYSEEARKAKYSGTVLLSLVIDASGNTRDIHVVRPLGLGLDEKAIEAVMRWRFRPAMKGGHAVSVQAQVEVNFRLL